MAANEQNAVAQDTSVTTIRLRADIVRQARDNSGTTVATLCEKRGTRHTLEIQLASASNSRPAARMRIGAVPALESVIELISSGRDALELNGASPVRVNIAEEDYTQLVKHIADHQQYAANDIERIWLAGVRAEKSTRAAAGRLQLIGADGSVLNLNWGGDTLHPDRAALPSTIHPVDFSTPRG